MKKGTFLFLIFLFTGSIFAQEDEGTIVSLLPEGVLANIDDNRKEARFKNLVVAGEKTIGYKAFFAAADAAHGEELWVTNGTPEGTFMVKDINPGSGSSNINWMARFNNKVVFAADDGENGMELWISDGTEAGTYMVKDIHEYGDSDPRGFTQINENQFIFLAMDFESETYSIRGPQSWLWVSDGTEAGTKLIYECDMRWPGQDWTSWWNFYCRVKRNVFFKADNKDGTVGEELWITDGTRAGTKFVKDINTEPGGGGTLNSAIDNMINFYNEKLFFKAFSIESNNEPWASDGTEEGTYEIFDSNPTFEDSGFPRGGGASDAGQFPYKGHVYFRAWSMDAGCEIGKTNLEQGNLHVFDINTNHPTNDNHSFGDVGVEYDGVYMFCAATGFNPDLPNNFGGELHYTDGETVTMPWDFVPGTGCMWVKELTVASGSLYWWNEGGDPVEYARKLFRINDKDDYPIRITDFNPGGPDRIHTLRNLGGDLLFSRRLGPGENELYVYNYRKPDFDPEKDVEFLDIEYRTRDEIINDIRKNTIAGTNKLMVYPNPATDIFEFYVEDRALNVKLFDLSGRLVISESNIRSNAVSVSALKTGIYNVVVTGTKGNYVTKLVIK